MDQFIIDKLTVIWNYLHLNQTPQISDLIICLGSEYLNVANRAVDLYFQNLAPTILFSGGFGVITKNTINLPEAEIFKSIALKLGVPLNAIYTETKASNTGENIENSRQFIFDHQLPHHRIVLVTKPDMERRLFATFKKIWPEPEIFITSPQVTLQQYLDDYGSDLAINLMVGYVQRMKLYALQGYQISQDIPEDVWQAHLDLIALGYNQQLVK